MTSYRRSSSTPIPVLTRILHKALDWSFKLTGKPLEVIMDDELRSAKDAQNYFTLFLPNHKRSLDGLCLAYALLSHNLQPYPKFFAHYRFRTCKLESTLLHYLGVYMPRFRSHWLKASAQELERATEEIERLVQPGRSLVLFLESGLSSSGQLNLPHLFFFRLILKLCQQKGYLVRLVPVGLTYDNIPEVTIASKLHRIQYTVSSYLKGVLDNLVSLRRPGLWRKLRCNNRCQIIFSKPYILKLPTQTQEAISRQTVQRIAMQALQTVQWLSPITLSHIEAAAQWLLCPERPTCLSSKRARTLLGLELHTLLHYFRGVANPLHQTVAVAPTFPSVCTPDRSNFATSLKPSLQVLSEYQITYQLRSVLPNLLCLGVGRSKSKCAEVQKLFATRKEDSELCLKWLENGFFLPKSLMKTENQAIFKALPEYSRFNEMVAIINKQLLLPLLAFLNRACFARLSLSKDSLYELKSKCVRPNVSKQESI